VCPLWKSKWRVLKTLKMDLHYNLARLLLSIYLKECKSINKRNTCIFIFIAGLSLFLA
jgi:hypothetical protein